MIGTLAKLIVHCFYITKKNKTTTIYIQCDFNFLSYLSRTTVKSRGKQSMYTKAIPHTSL